MPLQNWQAEILLGVLVLMGLGALWLIVGAVRGQR